jgi:hypothetical protein
MGVSTSSDLLQIVSPFIEREDAYEKFQPC